MHRFQNRLASKTAQLLSVSLCFVLLALACHDPEMEARSQALAGQPAPAFTLPDSNGQTHSLSDFSGQLVVLEWVNFDCPYVRKHYESGNMQALQERYTEQGVTWLMINSSAPGKQGNFEPAEINRRLAAHNAHPTAYLLDPDGTVGRSYGAKATPHMYVISTEGKIVYQGAIDSIASTDQDDIAEAHNYVDQALHAVMAGESPPVASTSAYGCSVKYL